MTRAEIFTTIKKANKIVDQMAVLKSDSAEYAELNEELSWTLDPLFYNKRRNYFVNMSQKTGHYYVKFI